MPIPTGVLHRWRADTVTGLTSGAKMTATVANEGSSSLTLVQTTDTLRPLWIAANSNLNNHATFRHDGVDDILLCASFDTPAAATAVFIGWLDPAKTTAGQPFYATVQEVFWTLDTQHGLFRPSGAVAAAGNPTREATVWTGLFLTTGADFRKKGTVAASSAAGSNNGQSATTAGLGNHTNTGLGRSWPGDWAEFLYWDRVLTTAELADVHSYAQDTYGVTVSDYVASSPGPAFGAAAFDPAAFDTSAPAGGTAAAQDAVAFTDSVSIDAVRAATAQDTAALSDALSLAAVRALATSDALSLTDAASAAPDGQMLASSAQDGMAPTDAVSTAAARAQSTADTEALVDSVVAAAARAQSTADTEALVDSVVAAAARAQSTADTEALVDSVVAAAARAQSTADTEALVDEVVTAAVRVLAVSDTVGLVEQADVVVLRVDITDVVALQDTVLAGSSSARVADATETVALDDSIGLTSTLSLSVGDTLPLADSATSTAILLRQVNDTLAVPDTITTAAGRSTSVGDTLALTDDVFIPGAPVTRPAFVLHRNRVLVHVGAGIYR